MKRLLFLFLCFAGFGCLAQEVADADAPTNYFPLWQAGQSNMVDMVLIYEGAASRPHWDSDHYAPYVTYRDRKSGQEQWLFDGFLFIEYMDGRGYGFESGLKEKPGHKTQWQWLLDRHFGSDGIQQLEKNCHDAIARIGPPIRRRQVVLTIPSPAVDLTNWGAIDGRALDFRKMEDRVAACSWYVDQAMKKWQALNPPDLDLAGFYWLDEEVPDAAGFLHTLSEKVHTCGKKFYWIPYWQPAGLPTNWPACGFDTVWQQPNYFFDPTVSIDRLKTAMEFASQNRMGVEMEFDDRILSRPEVYQPRFQAYLDAFAKYGADQRSSIGYYEGGGALYSLSVSPNPETRALYDQLCRRILRRQERADEHLANALKHRPD